MSDKRDKMSPRRGTATVPTGVMSKGLREGRGEWRKRIDNATRKTREGERTRTMRVGRGKNLNMEG